MPRRYTTQEFSDKLRAKHPHLSVQGEYVNMLEPIEIRCGVCENVWKTSPASIMRGKGCPKCTRMERRATTEEARRRIAEANKDVEIIGGYTCLSNKAELKCLRCGHTWSAKPMNIIHGSGCPICGVKKRGKTRAKTHEQFCEEMKKAHPDIDVIGTYTRSTDRVEVRCSRCGRTWNPVAEQVLHGIGCSSCNRKSRRTDSEFRSMLISDERHITPLDDYMGLSKKIRFKCDKCGNVWSAVPSSILRGSGCPRCNTRFRAFFEHALLFAFRHVYGDDNVLSRVKSQIGVELDVYVKDLNLAFEPGAWLYHKNTIDRDYAKVVACSTAGMRLETLYFGCDDPDSVPSWASWTRSALSSCDWGDVVETITNYFEKYGVDYDGIDWDEIRRKALDFNTSKTTDEFKDDIKCVNKDIEVLGEYHGGSEYIEVRCRVCGHIWSARANNLLHGKGCPKCKIRKSKERNLLTQEEFVSKASIKAPTIEVLGEYTGTDNKIEVRCKLCGRVWMSKAGNILIGRACTHCSRKLTNDQFLERVAERNPTVIPLEKYFSGKQKMLVKCARCGNVWSTTPRRIIDGKGCLKCSWIDNGMKLRKSNDSFVSDLSKANPNIEPLDEYTTTKAKIRFKCKACGNVWSARPGNILSGRGCPVCSRKKAAEKHRKHPQD